MSFGSAGNIDSRSCELPAEARGMQLHRDRVRELGVLPRLACVETFSYTSDHWKRGWYASDVQ